MLFVLLGAAAVIFGVMGVAFAVTGEKDNLKKYVGTQNRGLAVVLGIVSVAIGLALICWILFM